jgi:hypothetical protein
LFWVQFCNIGQGPLDLAAMAAQEAAQSHRALVLCGYVVFVSHYFFSYFADVIK